LLNNSWRISLTNNYLIISKINPLAANVYKSKEEDHLGWREIATKYEITPSEAHALYKNSKRIIKDGDFTWLDGLSQKAITQLLKTNYTTKCSLCSDIRNEVIDLETLPKVGHGIAQEVRRWCVTSTRGESRIMPRQGSDDAPAD
jgi:hypothetical protein